MADRGGAGGKNGGKTKEYSLTASIHSDEVGPSSDVQTKLEKRVLPQRQFPLPRGFFQMEHAIILADRSRGLLVLCLEAQGSLRVSLAAFSGTILRLRHDILPSAAHQR